MIKVKCYTWQDASVVLGASITADSKLGQVVFLGEEGRGRRWEKVSLDRKNPPLVVGGRVMNAVVRSFKLPPRDGKLEKEIVVLEREPEGEERKAAAIVRVSCYSGYRKNARGIWRTVSGEPRCIIEGCGAFGDAGRIGGWRDSLVIMTEGDVIKVSPTCDIHGVYDFALWMEKGGEVKTASWAEYERLQAKSKAEAIIAEAKGSAGGLNLVTGSLQCSTYVGRGEFQNGIEVTAGATGAAVILGEAGRGRVRSEVPIVGFAAGQLLGDIVVVELSHEEKPASYFEAGPTVKIIYGLTDGGDREEDDVHLVRIVPDRSPHRSFTHIEALRGEPLEIARGRFASGDAGLAGNASDVLYVLRPGDAVKIADSRVVRNNNGVLEAPLFGDWEAADGLADPEAYIAKGKAPFGQVPEAWLGRVVSVIYRKMETGRYGDYVAWPEGEPGELVSRNPLVLNMGWDGRDRRLVTVGAGVWVKLHADLQAKPLQGEEAREREEAKADLARLQAEAKESRGATWFSCLNESLRQRVGQVADGRVFSTWDEGSRLDFAFEATGDIRRWNESAKAVMAEAGEASTAAKELERRQRGGEVLVNFAAWKRRGGATNCGQGWVIRPDGSLREPDSMDCPRPRHSDEGTQKWDLVEAEELAISWSKAYTAAPHEFAVTKPPVGRVTPAQRETAKQLEDEIAAQFGGSLGISGRECPPVGRGWGLLSGTAEERLDRGHSRGDDKPAAPAPVVAPEAPAAVFTHGGKRDFRCPSGHWTRLTSSEFAQYQQGQAMPMVCTVCGAQGQAKK